MALVTETFLPKVDGVVTRLVATLESLKRAGHEVLVLAPPGAPTEVAGHEVVSAPGIYFPWYPEHTAAVPAPRLGRALDEFEPHLIHVVNPVFFGAWGTFAAKRRRLPLLASFHTDPKVVRRLNLAWFERPLKFIDRELHNLAHVTLCTSPQMMALARGLGIRRVRLWPKAVDNQRFKPGSATPEMRARLSGGDPYAPLVVCAGRVSFEKRVDVLAAAIKLLQADPIGRELRFAVVGDGPALEWLKQELAGTPTQFAGFLAGEELSAAYASGDLFAFPSDSETLGFAAIEAMASGVAVVAADAGGIPHIVKSGVTGLLVAPGSPEALAAGLKGLVEDDETRRRLAAAGHREAQRWSWDAATASLIHSYRLALKVQRQN